MPKRKREPTAAAESPPLVPQEHGGALLAGGVPGHAGGGGRPIEELRRKCREAILTRAGVEFVAGVMDGTETEDVVVQVRDEGGGWSNQVEKVRPKVRDRLLAFELLADRGFGKPLQKLEVEQPELRKTGEQVVARILELLPRVIAFLPVEKRELMRLLERGRQRELLVSGREVKKVEVGGEK